MRCFFSIHIIHNDIIHIVMSGIFFVKVQMHCIARAFNRKNASQTIIIHYFRLWHSLAVMDSLAK